MTPKGHAPRDAWGRFTPGPSGNPLGRPKKWRRGEIKAAMDSMDPEDFARWLLRRAKHSHQASAFLLGFWSPHHKYGIPRVRLY
jgi:hypothetical protein